MEVTESSLASALESFQVRVRSSTGGMGTSSAELADADETAKVLYATLSRMAALREHAEPGLMMTGPEHYQEAERMLAVAEGYGIPDQRGRDLAALAQVHATLALAAATAAGRGSGNA